jgi:hypothetical protein
MMLTLAILHYRRLDEDWTSTLDSEAAVTEPSSA